MTCLAWDGEILAADLGGTSGNLVTRVGKLFVAYKKDSTPIMLALCGSTQSFDSIVRYFSEAGEKFDYRGYGFDPDQQLGLLVDEYKCLYVIGADMTLRPCPLVPWYALGSGSNFIAGALSVGANSIQAIEQALIYSTEAGIGVDHLSWSEVFK